MQVKKWKQQKYFQDTLMKVGSIKHNLQLATGRNSTEGVENYIY